MIGTCRWEYTYDGRGNLISEDKYTRTTTGMDWQNVATYVYDETNRMVEGKNEQGEYSLYTYNGLGVRVARELVMLDNTHGYTDFHKETPSVDAGITKAEVVKESYVIDYTSATFNPLTMDEVGGFNYRYIYGLDKLSVKITSEGTNWWGQNVTTDILKDYYHQDRMGSTTNLTDKFGRVVGRADYNEWGQITFKDALDITSSYRRIYPQLNYTGHDWDDVLGMYYAKARFYSADDKRFVAMDPMKGSITDPLSLVSYLYCVDNPLRWVDPLGLKATSLLPTAEITGNNVNFRAEPSLSATSYLQFQKGMHVVDLGGRVDADGYRWANVKYNGLTGWVATKYLKILSSPQKDFQLVLFDDVQPSTNANTELVLPKQKENGMQETYLDESPAGNNVSSVPKEEHQTDAIQSPTPKQYGNIEPVYDFSMVEWFYAACTNPTQAADLLKIHENYIYNSNLPQITGYINGQGTGNVAGYRYGDYFMSYNGCEVIANYNALIALGNPQNLNDVANWSERNGSIMRGAFGTLPISTRLLFENLGYTVKKVTDSAMFDAEAKKADACIFTYFWFDWGWPPLGAHTVYVKVNGNSLDVYNEFNSWTVPYSRKSFVSWINDEKIVPIVLYCIYK